MDWGRLTVTRNGGETVGGGTDAELDWREYLVCNGVGFENLRSR